MMMHRTAAFIAALALFLGCGGDGPPAADAPPDTAATMQGMEGMGMDAAMMQQMMAHMETMRGMRGDGMTAALPMHRQRVANMIAQMNREMREMDMAADAAWDATVDSLREDLTLMPEMSAAELERLMPGHAARVERLLQMHERMMTQMHR